MSDVIRRQNNQYNPRDLEAFLSKEDSLDIAELFRETVGRRAYYSFLRTHFRREVRLTRVHSAIAQLAIPTVFTTNFDHLLETCIHRAAGCRPTSVVTVDQLRYIDDTEPRVIKLHGDIDHPSTIILTRSDYASYAVRHRAFAEALQTSLNGWVTLFIGFGLRDPNFRRIYADARALHDGGRQAYALMTGVGPVERSLWQEEGLTIIPMSGHSQLGGLLGKLRAP